MSARSLGPPIRWVGLALLSFSAVLMTTPGSAQESTISPEASALLKKVIATYQSAPGLEDEIELKLDFGPQSPPLMRSKITVGAGTDLSIDEMPMSGLGMTSVGGKLYVFLLDQKKAARFTLGDQPMSALPPEFGQGMPLAPHLPLRWGAEPSAVLRALTWGLIETPKLERLEEVSGEGSIQRLHLSGSVPFSEEPATATVDVDTATHFVMASSVSAMSPNGAVKISIKNQPKRLDAAPAIAFDAESYELEDSIEALFGDQFGGDINPSVEVGAAAPAFALVDQDGKKRSLESLKGKYVLLDWWGIW